MPEQSICAAAVKRPDGLTSLLSYETAGIAAFCSLHTEDCEKNHPNIGKSGTAHISGRRTTELPDVIFSIGSQDNCRGALPVGP